MPHSSSSATSTSKPTANSTLSSPANSTTSTTTPSIPLSKITPMLLLLRHLPPLWIASWAYKFLHWFQRIKYLNCNSHLYPRPSSNARCRWARWLVSSPPTINHKYMQQLQNLEILLHSWNLYQMTCTFPSTTTKQSRSQQELTPKWSRLLPLTDSNSSQISRSISHLQASSSNLKEYFSNLEMNRDNSVLVLIWACSPSATSMKPQNLSKCSPIILLPKTTISRSPIPLSASIFQHPSMCQLEGAPSPSL